MYFFYNKETKTIIGKTHEKNWDNIKKDDFKTIFYKDEKIVAINIFNQEIDQDGGMINNIKKLEKIINELKLEIKIDNFKNIEKGIIKNIEKHPKNDKLIICQFEDQNKDQTQIITNQINLQKDDKIIFYKAKCFTPSGIEILESEISGIKSYGMIASNITLNKNQENKIAKW